LAGVSNIAIGPDGVKAPKIATTIWLDADRVAHFRASGPGWQSRINAALRAALNR
jgi:uncharacterized protein (DUF4415 family)